MCGITISFIQTLSYVWVPISVYLPVMFQHYVPMVKSQISDDFLITAKCARDPKDFGDPLVSSTTPSGIWIGRKIWTRNSRIPVTPSIPFHYCIVIIISICLLTITNRRNKRVSKSTMSEFRSMHWSDQRVYLQLFTWIPRTTMPKWYTFYLS